MPVDLASDEQSRGDLKAPNLASVTRAVGSLLA
jgi:hypothetical protein